MPRRNESVAAVIPFSAQHHHVPYRCFESFRNRVQHGLCNRPSGVLHQLRLACPMPLGRQPVHLPHFRRCQCFHIGRTLNLPASPAEASILLGLPASLATRPYSIHPPLTFTTCPVTYSASSEAKNATEAATSSTVGGRPIGNRASRSLRASSKLKSFSSMLDGFTTFTVIPFFASSSANERDSATTAALAAAYAEILAWPKARSAPTAPRFTIRPQRPLRMCGSAARLMKTTLIKLEAKMSCQSSSEPSASVPQRKSPTLLTKMSRRPKRL